MGRRRSLPERFDPTHHQVGGDEREAWTISPLKRSGTAVDVLVMGGSTVGAWFACPHCGTDLPEGAIRCSHCDRSLLAAPPPTDTGPGADPPAQAPPLGPGPRPPWERRPTWTDPPPRAVSGERRVAVASCVIGGAALALRLLIPLLARFSPTSIVYLFPLTWLMLPGSVGGLLLGLRARRSIAATGDAHGLTLATVGTWIGWTNVALFFLGFVLPPLEVLLSGASR